MAWYIIVLYGISFFICAADIPYFNQFFKHLNPSIFNWTGEKSFVVEMIFKEPKYLLFLAVFIVAVILFSFLIFRYIRWIYKGIPNRKFGRGILQIAMQSLICIVCILLCFVGMRGRIALKSPIRVGTAYFSEYAFANLLGLNPVFYLLNTVISESKNKDKDIILMDEAKAVQLAQQYLGIQNPDPDYPIAREAEAIDSLPSLRSNVVLILMEGVSAANLERHGATNPKFRFLDSLTNSSYYFENCYSAGIHTMNGIYGTLFSYPAFFNVHPLKANDIPAHESFPSVLKDKGYKTIYFTTHDDQFDNVGGFLTANHVEKIISQKDYPSSKVLSNLGVPDDYMFEFSMPILNQMAESGSPFFATFMTASNHPPITIPEYFKPTAGDEKEQVMEYADWSLRKFFDMAKQQAWYNNTIFVLLGDHGAIVGNQLYDLSLSYNHIPLIIVSSGMEPKAYSQPTGQIDVFPTVMGLLNQPYVNNTMGVDAINTPRPYIYFSADNIMGCIDKEWLYLYRLDGRESLYSYSTLSTHDALSEYRECADSMKSYAFSMLQTSRFVEKNGKVSIKR